LIKQLLWKFKNINLNEYFEKKKTELLIELSAEFPEKSEEDLIAFAPQYYATKAIEEMDRLFEKNGWGEEKIEQWVKGHFRTPYKVNA
jgi:hypothetical protein